VNIYEVWLLSVLLVILTGCHDSYRYPCQDPQNWGKAECEPPQCEAAGVCTKDLVTKEIYNAYKQKNP
jgi:hypothetical protein